MMGRKMCKDMHKEIRLEVDGKIVELPPVEGIIILNILRYCVILLIVSEIIYSLLFLENLSGLNI